MSKKIVIHNCTVEIDMPDLELREITYSPNNPKIRVRAMQNVENVLVRNGDRTLRIGKLFVESLTGVMLPVAEGERVVFFTPSEDADLPTVVNPDPKATAKPRPEVVY